MLSHFKMIQTSNHSSKTGYIDWYCDQAFVNDNVFNSETPQLEALIIRIPVYLEPICHFNQFQIIKIMSLLIRNPSNSSSMNSNIMNIMPYR